MAAGFNSEKESRIDDWIRWIAPSIADLIFLAFLGVLSFTSLSVRLLGDAGIGWHIRTGQLILSTHEIPRADPFSSSMAGQPWFAWEWLYDVAVGWIERAAGLNGVVVLTAVVIALTFSLTFRLLQRRNANLLVAVALVLLAASVSMIHFFARPHVFSWLFSVAWFGILDSFDRNQPGATAQVRRRDRLVWLLPLSMVLWVNLHGGFLLGFVLLAIAWLSAMWQWLRPGGEKLEEVLIRPRAGKRARDLIFVGGMSVLATFINPYGWKLHAHIYHYLSNRFLMDHIEEFQSPNFHGVAQKCFAVLLLLALFALALGKREDGSSPVSEILLVLFAVYSGLYASRNLPVSALLLILVIGPRLNLALQSLVEVFRRRRPATQGSQPIAEERFLFRMQAIDSGLQGHLWPLAAALLTCWIAFHGGKLGTSPMMNAHFDGHRFPVAGVDYLHECNVTEPIFAPDSWGGYLIYRLYPQTKVVVDDRHDFYGEDFLTAYLKTVHVEPDWEDFLAAQNVRWAVIPKGSALASILRESPRWQPVYADDTAAVFEAPVPASRLQNPSH
jgi:hypothetical protein